MDAHQIAKKRQKRWKDEKIYQVKNDSTKPKFYVLDMFPYPSGAGLHVGHPKGYIATDVISRKKLLQWFNVLHPMGFDTFWLWTENYAIEHKIKPQKAAADNIETFKQQLEKFGFTYDRDREVNTADPKFFKRTQQIFLKLYNHYYNENDKIAKPIKELKERLENEWKNKEEIQKILDQERLAYIDYKPINRCPKCCTGLANEDLDDGKCERCGSEIEQKPMRQRVLRITKYAQRLLDWLDKLDRDESMKELERNRIGKSSWTQFKMNIQNSDDSFEVYTTRVDTVFGMTFVVMSPEHPLVDKITTPEYKEWVEKYKEEAKHKTQLERTELQKEKTGQFTGAYAINPFNGKKVKIYIGDYVLANYGTGVVMAVPAHDERDFEFAKKHDIKIIQSIKPKNKDYPNFDEINKCNICYTDKWIVVNSWEFTWLTSDEAIIKIQKWLQENNLWWKKINYKIQDRVFSRQRYRWEPFPIIFCNHCDTKININFYNQETRNGIISGQKTIETRALNPEEPDRYFWNIKKWNIILATNKETNQELRLQITNTYQRNNLKDMWEKADKKTLEKMYRNKENFQNTKNFESFYSKRDFKPGYLEKINKNWIIGREIKIIGPKTVPMNESDLPLNLPDVENYEPTWTEEGPLADIESRINTTCPTCWWPAKRESNTMPGWAGSSRYWMRYMDPKNDNELVSPEADKYRENVDVYVWWAEHVTRHMIYARFRQKFLFDLGIASQDEPFKKYQKVGLIMGQDWRKMSKRRWNVVNPDDVIAEFGNDALRVYEMFMWPFDQSIDRNTAWVKGVKKFLEKIEVLIDKIKEWYQDSPKTLFHINTTIKKVWEDIDNFRYNTAISQMMIMMNHCSEQEAISKESYEKICVLLSPFAPHLAEELREKLRNEFSIFTKASRPVYDETKLTTDEVTLAVQVNGKMRWTILLWTNSNQETAFELAKNDPKISKYIDWEPKKIIYVPGKILNVII